MGDVELACAELSDADPDDGGVVELVTDVEVAVAVEILPKMDEAMAAIFVSAADCTPSQRTRSVPLYVYLFKAGQYVRCTYSASH